MSNHVLTLCLHVKRSHTHSRKGKELQNFPHAAITFWWGALHRSVRFEGDVLRISEEESDEYYTCRPTGSKVGALFALPRAPSPLFPCTCIEKRLEDTHQRMTSTNSSIKHIRVGSPVVLLPFTVAGRLLRRGRFWCKCTNLWATTALRCMGALIRYKGIRDECSRVDVG